MVVNKKDVASLILSAVLGIAVLIVPVIGVPAEPDPAGYFLPIVPKAFHSASFRVHVPLLFVAGFIPSLLSATSFLAIGAATTVFLPVWSILDIVDAYLIDGVERHNLLPIEWFFYGVLSLPGILGAWTGRLIRRRWLA